jgi:hypothetical protein
MSQATTAVRATASSAEVPVFQPLSHRVARKPASTASAMVTAIRLVRRDRAAATKYNATSTARNWASGISPTLSGIVPSTAAASSRPTAASGRRLSRRLPSSARAVASARKVRPSQR